MPKVLLDTNIIIYRETDRILNPNTPDLFNWLDRLHYDKYIHPISEQEISQYADVQKREVILSKLGSYNKLTVLAPLAESIQNLLRRDGDVNSQNDTKILNELYCGRVDIFITEDRQLYNKARCLGVADKVFSIESFSEKMLSEHPDLIDYNVLAVRKKKIGELNVHDEFFDSLRESYGGIEFDNWLNRKSQEDAYVCYLGEDLKAFLYLKQESEEENYSDIDPILPRKKRLKIGTFKVAMNGLKLGERFLKIAFDNAINMNVDEIYVTIFDSDANDLPKQALVKQLCDFGFLRWGTKGNGEGVYVRDMAKVFNNKDPKHSFPLFNRYSDTYICPIYPSYHTSLLPDSILNNESPYDFQENKPFRNAITKVYISRSIFRDLKRGDNIIFYRTGGLYQGVITTIGVVNRVLHPDTLESFKDCCKRRTIFTDSELEQHWNYNRKYRPFVVEFLYVYSLPLPKVNLKALCDEGILSLSDMPRGFYLISHGNFNKILKMTRTDLRYVVENRI